MYQAHSVCRFPAAAEPCRIDAAKLIDGLSGTGHAGKVDGPHLVDQVVIGHRHAVGVESIGADDVRPGLQVAAVDAGDGLGLGNCQQVIAALEVAVVGGKLRRRDSRPRRT